MSPNTTVEERDLHAFLDGELDSERRRAVEEHLQQHPGDAALVENWRRQNAALRAAFEPVALELPPLSLRDAALRTAAPAQGPIETGAIHWGRPGAAPRPPRRIDEIRASRRRQAIVSTLLTLLAGAAVAALVALIFAGRNETRAPVALGVAQGYVARAGLTYATFAADARPVEIEAARAAELAAWLQARVGFSRPPDLTAVGLRLLGGRVAPGLVAPAGLLLYQRADGGRVGLYFERAEAASAPQAPRAGAALAAIEWRAGAFAFVLVGPLPVEEMQAAAELAAAAVVAPEPAPAR